MKLIKQLIFGKAASGESILQPIKLNTTYPDTTLPYNQWTIYISKQLN